MFKKIKEWFTKKPESIIEMKVVPENYNPVKASIPPLQPQVVAPLTIEQANSVYTATVTSALPNFEVPVVKAVDQQAVVEAAEGSALTPTKKPRKPRQTKAPLASWPFPTNRPSEGSAVTQAELDALRVDPITFKPIAIKVSKPRKSRPEKDLYVSKKS